MARLRLWCRDLVLLCSWGLEALWAFGLLDPQSRALSTDRVTLGTGSAECTPALAPPSALPLAFPFPQGNPMGTTE